MKQLKGRFIVWRANRRLQKRFQKSFNEFLKEGYDNE